MSKYEDPQFQWMLPDMDPLEQTCRAIEADVHEEGWDQKPHFYTLSIVGNLPSIDLTELEGSTEPLVGGLCTTEIRLPDFCYDDPANGLRLFLQFLGEEYAAAETNKTRKELVEILDRLVPQQFQGFGIVYEGWALNQGIVSFQEAQEFMAHNRISTHPQRVEMRGMLVATYDGRVVSLTRERDKFPEYHEAEMPVDSMAGRIPDGIRLMTNMFHGFDEWRVKVIQRLESQS